MEFHLSQLKGGLQGFLDQYGDDLHQSHLDAVSSALKSLKSIEFYTGLPLVVVDLNGVMIETEFVPDMEVKREGWIRVGKSLRRPLPNAIQFFDWYQKNKGKVRIAVWSSSYVSNVLKTIDGLFPSIKNELAFIWGQENCEALPNPEHDPADKKSKPTLFWKNTSEILKHFPQYQLENILIVDDSKQKLEKNDQTNVMVVDENSHLIDDLLESPFGRQQLKDCGV